MNKYNKYPLISGVKTMGIRDLEEIFSDESNLRIMYYLAKENPNITGDAIAENFSMNKTLVEAKMAKFTKFNIVDYKENSGYTLTDQGLAMLYNFHKSFVVQSR